MHNFNKYSLPNFNGISSTDSKVDTINKFYKDLVKLNMSEVEMIKSKKSRCVKKCNTALQ